MRDTSAVTVWGDNASFISIGARFSPHMMAQTDVWCIIATVKQKVCHARINCPIGCSADVAHPMPIGKITGTSSKHNSIAVTDVCGNLVWWQSNECTFAWQPVKRLGCEPHTESAGVLSFMFVERRRKEYVSNDYCVSWHAVANFSRIL